MYRFDGSIRSMFSVVSVTPAARTRERPHSRTMPSISGDVDRTMATKIVAIDSGIVTKIATITNHTVRNMDGHDSRQRAWLRRGEPVRRFDPFDLREVLLLVPFHPAEGVADGERAVVRVHAFARQLLLDQPLAE